MSKWLKRLTITVAVVVICTAGVAVFLKFYLTKDRITAWVKPPLEQYLGRRVTLADAGASFRGLRLEGLEIRQKKSRASLLKGDYLELRWNLAALLKAKFEIRSFVFVKPDITLIRQEDGSLNISDLIGREEPSDATPPPQPKDDSKTKRIPLFISMMSMKDGRLTLIDRSRQPEATMQLTNLQSRISDISTSGPISFQVKGQIGEENKGGLAIQGTVNLASNTIECQVGFNQIDLATLISFFGKAKSIPIEQGNLTLKASLAAADLDRFRGEGSLNLADLQVNMDGVPSETFAIGAGFNLQAVKSNRELKIGALNLDLNGQKVEIQGTLSEWDKRPLLDFTLTSPQFRLAELVGLMPSDSTQPDKSKKKAKAAAQKPVPLDAQGKIHLDWLFYDKFVASNVDCQVDLKDGRLQLKPLTATLYGGELEGATTAWLEKAGPPFHFNISTKDVLLDEVVRAFLPDTGQLWTGSMSLDSQAKGVGSDLRTLNSSSSLKIEDAKFSGHPLVVKLAELFQAEELQQLNFSRISGSVFTNQGLATFRDFILEGPAARVQGDGTTNLLDKKLDLGLLFDIRAQYVGKFDKIRSLIPKITNKHGFVQVPVDVGGTLNEPQYALNERWLADMTKEAAKESLKKLDQTDLPQMRVIPQVPSLSEQRQKHLQSEEKQKRLP